MGSYGRGEEVGKPNGHGRMDGNPEKSERTYHLWGRIYRRRLLGIRDLGLEEIVVLGAVEQR